MLQRFLQTFSEAHKAPFDGVCKPSRLKMGVKTTANHGANLAAPPVADVGFWVAFSREISTNNGFSVAPIDGACANARHESS
jgi:hypothetical protein